MEHYTVFATRHSSGSSYGSSMQTQPRPDTVSQPRMTPLQRQEMLQGVWDDSSHYATESYMPRQTQWSYRTETEQEYGSAEGEMDRDEYEDERERKRRLKQQLDSKMAKQRRQERQHSSGKMDRRLKYAEYEVGRDTTNHSVQFRSITSVSSSCQLILPKQNLSSDQLRLLRFSPSGKEMRLQSSVWHRVNAPAYYGISYVWGQDAALEEMLVDNEPRYVLKNCHEALEQARALGQHEYIWIDSICINQRDITEKNAQVKRMWATYTQAAQVLVCIGSEGDDVAFLLPLMYRLEEAAARFLVEESIDWTSVLQSFSRPSLLYCRAAIRDFSQRPYWNRLWVVQEVAAARGSAIVLCGPHRIPWSHVRLLVRFARAYDAIEERRYDDVTDMENLVRTTIDANTLLSVAQVFKRFGHAKCTNLLDRLYGLLPLIKWPKGLESLCPDYSFETVDLALYLWLRQYVAKDDVEYMLSAFELDWQTYFMAMRDMYRANVHCPRGISDNTVDRSNMRAMSQIKFWADRWKDQNRRLRIMLSRCALRQVQCEA